MEYPFSEFVVSCPYCLSLPTFSAFLLREKWRRPWVTKSLVCYQLWFSCKSKYRTIMAEIEIADFIPGQTHYSLPLPIPYFYITLICYINYSVHPYQLPPACCPLTVCRGIIYSLELWTTSINCPMNSFSHWLGSISSCGSGQERHHIVLKCHSLLRQDHWALAQFFVSLIVRWLRWLLPWLHSVTHSSNHGLQQFINTSIQYH